MPDIAIIYKTIPQYRRGYFNGLRSALAEKILNCYRDQLFPPFYFLLMALVAMFLEKLFVEKVQANLIVREKKYEEA